MRLGIGRHGQVHHQELEVGAVAERVEGGSSHHAAGVAVTQGHGFLEQGH